LGVLVSYKASIHPASVECGADRTSGATADGRCGVAGPPSVGSSQQAVPVTSQQAVPVASAPAPSGTCRAGQSRAHADPAVTRCATAVSRALRPDAITVSPARVKLTAAEPGVPAPAGGYWRSDAEDIPLGEAVYGNAIASALGRQWTWYGQTQENLEGHPEIVSAKAEGILGPPAGDRVIKLMHVAGDPATHHKLYKTFTAKNWPNGEEPYRRTDGTPADVSARYITFEYLPSAQLRLSPIGWINLAQLKEGYTASNGVTQSDPSWFFGVKGSASGHLWFSLGSNGGKHDGRLVDARPYLDSWVKIEMRVYQGDRIELYLNDALFDTGHQSEYPVGRNRYVGRPVDDTSATVTREEGWVFGTGNYSNPGDSNGSNSLVYVDLSTVLPLS